MGKVLPAGHNMIIHQKVAGVSTPYYPMTKSANIFNAKGESLDEILATFQVADAEHMVPDYSAEEVSGLRFLRNDNTWANIQAASTEQAGVVKLTDDVKTEDSTLAASATSVKNTYAKIEEVEKNVADANYVKNAQLGAASTEDTIGVATLDESGKIYAKMLPSFVDDVVEVGFVITTTDGVEVIEKAVDENGADITPESGKLYVNALPNTVDGVEQGASEKTYRWSGTKYSVVSDTIALGETETTAFDGRRGKIAYDHSQTAHAMATATEVTASEDNGYINIKTAEGAEATKTLVYKHPEVDGATETNPHGTTAADVGLGKVENKTAEEILDELTSDQITDALGYTAQDAGTLASATQDGIMSKGQAAKLDTCMPIYVQKDAPEGDGIWFQVVTEDDDTTPDDGGDNTTEE